VILGTSGALDNTREFFERETFVVVNGKIITDIDLNAALETHRKHERTATLVLFRTLAASVSASWKLKPVESKDSAACLSTKVTSAVDVYRDSHLEPRIFEYVPRGVFQTRTDVYPKAMANGEIVAAHVASGKWRELSTLKRYLDISVEMLKEEGKSLVRCKRDCSRSATVTIRFFGTTSKSAPARVSTAPYSPTT
jgi:NDP-sugar pyrophosphorylase family protein